MYKIYVLNIRVYIHVCACMYITKKSLNESAASRRERVSTIATERRISRSRESAIDSSARAYSSITIDQLHSAYRSIDLSDRACAAKVRADSLLLTYHLFNPKRRVLPHSSSRLHACLDLSLLTEPNINENNRHRASIDRSQTKHFEIR